MDNQNNPQFHTVRGYQMLSLQDGRMTSSMEDYLEMIYRLCVKDGYTRVGRLSGLLHVKPSSASKMIFKLAELNYIHYDRYEVIFLTEEGKNRGKFLLERHNTVENFLKLIGISDTLEETELLEHSLNPEATALLGKLLEFFRRDPGLLQRWQSFLSSPLPGEEQNRPRPEETP